MQKSALCTSEPAKAGPSAPNTPSNVVGIFSSNRLSLSADGFLCCVRVRACVRVHACGSLHCAHTADSARTAAPGISVMGTAGSMHHLNHSRLCVFNTAPKKRKKKKKTFTPADGNRMHARPVPPPLATRRRAGKCLPRRRRHREREKEPLDHSVTTEISKKNVTKTVAVLQFSSGLKPRVLIFNIAVPIFKTKSNSFVTGHR